MPTCIHPAQCGGHLATLYHPTVPDITWRVKFVPILPADNLPRSPPNQSPCGWGALPFRARSFFGVSHRAHTFLGNLRRSMCPEQYCEGSSDTEVEAIYVRDGRTLGKRSLSRTGKTRSDLPPVLRGQPDAYRAAAHGHRERLDTVSRHCVCPGPLGGHASTVNPSRTACRRRLPRDWASGWLGSWAPLGRTHAASATRRRGSPSALAPTP